MCGLAFAAVLDVLAFLLARYGPSRGELAPWSFRGNGALIVPFGLGPAVLAAGWTALILHGRRGIRWLAWSVGAGVVGIAAVAAAVATTVLGRMDLADRLTYPILAWAIVAPALALVLQRRAPQAGRLWHVIAAIVFVVALVGGFILSAQFLAPGS